MEKSQSSNTPARNMAFHCGPIHFRDPMGRHLLKGVTVSLTPPEVCVITGPSGSGKTSLLRAIGGLNNASVAERRLGGKTFSEKRLPEWRTRVTLLLQDAPCIHGTIRENLAFPFSLRNSASIEFPEQDAIRLLHLVGLSHFDLDHAVDGLSGGERHRLALVRGLLWKPAVLLADEPLSGLEPELAQTCFELLVEFAQNGPAAVICVLHEHRFAAQADTVLRLRDGTLY